MRECAVQPQPRPSLCSCRELGVLPPLRGPCHLPLLCPDADTSHLGLPCDGEGPGSAAAAQQPQPVPGTRQRTSWGCGLEVRVLPKSGTQSPSRLLLMRLSGKQEGGKRTPRGGMFEVLLHQNCVPQSHKLESYSLDLRVGSQPQMRPLQRGSREHGVPGPWSRVTGILTGRGDQDTDTQQGTTPWGPKGSTAVHTRGEGPRGTHPAHSCIPGVSLQDRGQGASAVWAPSVVCAVVTPVTNTSDTGCYRQRAMKGSASREGDWVSGMASGCPLQSSRETNLRCQVDGAGQGGTEREDRQGQSQR